MTHSQNEAYLAAFTEEQREYFLSFPIWANIAQAFGVFVFRRRVSFYYHNF
ncbi:MAG: hypothetical protein GJ671_02590 [Alteromonadaceae bacterium]|nr:hypothetical protein [Alteromonadaceae bacterium]